MVSSGSVSTVLAGNVSLTKNGSGTVTLSKVNTYTRTTTINGGTLNVTGKLAKNGSGNVLVHADATGTTTITQVLGHGESYAGLGSAVVGGELNTKADIMAGAVWRPTSVSVSMAWRTRDDVSNGENLISEVLSLDGIGAFGGGTDLFLLQMSYDPSMLCGSEADAIAKRGLYLATLSDSEWVRAVDENYRGTACWQGDMLVSSVAAGSLFDELGWYGVDTTNHVVWAVLSHDGYFAVVPEPSAIVLLGVGAIGLIAYAWRHRRQTM